MLYWRIILIFSYVLSIYFIHVVLPVKSEKDLEAQIMKLAGK